MKTTIEIADALLTDAKEMAVREKTTVRALVEQGLRHVLEGRKKQRPFRLKQVTVKGKGLHPDAGDGSWEIIRDMIYKGHGAQPVSLTEHS